MITYTNSLDFCPGGVPLFVRLSQYDSNFSLVFNCFSHKGDFTVENGSTAVFREHKPDGNVISIDATVSGTTVTLTPSADNAKQMTAIKGHCECEISLQKNGKELSSANFVLLVEKAPVDIDTVQSDSVIRELYDVADRADEILEGAQLVKDAVEDLPNLIDKTLTLADHAADSKAVGDALDEFTEATSYDQTYIDVPYDMQAYTSVVRGITFVQNTDGTVHASGTNSSSSASIHTVADSTGDKVAASVLLEKGKSYRLTGCPAGGSGSTWSVGLRLASGGGDKCSDYGSGVVFTPPETDQYCFSCVVRQNQTVNNLVFTPKLEEVLSLKHRNSAIDRMSRAEIRRIDASIDILNNAKDAIIECIEHLAWADDQGRILYNTLYDTLYPFVYSLDKPTSFNGLDEYIVPPVYLLKKDRSYTILVDFTEDVDFIASSVVRHVYRVYDALTGAEVSLREFPVSNNARIAVRLTTGQFTYTAPIAQSGHRRIRVAVSHEVGTEIYIAAISVDGVAVTADSGSTFTYDPTKVTNNQLAIGAAIGSDGTITRFFKGTVHDLQILDTAYMQEACNQYVLDVSNGGE